MTVNRLVLKWEEKIKLHREKEMKFSQWRSKNFRNKHPALVKEKNKMGDEGEVTNQEIVQGDRVNIQSGNSGTAANVQCYNRSEKSHYARNCPKPRVWDSKYFMEQMLLAKHDKVGVILIDEQNDFLFANASRMEEIKELSANICLIARIQPTNFDSDAGPSYDFEFLNLEARAKKNADVVLKISNSLQGMFMLGPKPVSFYNSNSKHGLGFANPYTLKKAISQYPKLNDASCFDDLKIHVNIRDIEDILDDATKSQIKMKNKLKDPIAIEK
ncbi:retrovirus-related pol polyprotein from transposon TNT 1-94 [Tanacetum coccineum]